jgi:TRAP-type C4-dicarboxylate transport system permease small subunit
MNPIKTAGLVLIVAGALGLAYGGFTYTRRSHEAQVGPFSMTMQDRQTVTIPIWAGLAAVVVGGVLLLLPVGKQ